MPTATASKNPNAKFKSAKSSADELADMLTPVMTAAMLARYNVLLVGKPGYGKTEIPKAMAEQVYGEDNVLLFPCSPSVRESDVIGYANPIYQIDPDAESKGYPYWVTRETPVDPKYQMVILDELSRLGELGSDAFVHAAHDVSKFHRPVYFGTANWLTPTPRNEALRDRFPFTLHYNPSVVDVRAVMLKKEIKDWVFDLPEASKIRTVQEWLEEYKKDADKVANYKAASVIATTLENFQRLCEGTPFEINNRRVRQYESVMYAMGCLFAEAKDFELIPAPAFEALSYMYPVIDLSESLQWRKIVLAMVDMVATAIAEFKANAYSQWKQIVAKHATKGVNPRELADVIGRDLGVAWQANEKELREQYGNDPRVDQALKEMFGIYRRMLKGEQI